MNGNGNREAGRLDDLLLDQAVSGLDVEQEQELQALLAGDRHQSDNPYMTTAALVQLGFARIDLERTAGSSGMPGHMRRKLERTARARLVRNGSETGADGDAPADNVVTLNRDADEPVTPRTSPVSYLGWGLAAAFAIALVMVGSGGQEIADPASQRQRLLSSSAAVMQLDWQGTESGFEQVRGDVVWSDSQQHGFMTLAGLPANNPREAQYQLWIIDPERGEQPVDGGVFDIPTQADNVIIPIDAKLPVDSPLAFAITLEQPGGVVVSGGPLLVVAQAES